MAERGYWFDHALLGDVLLETGDLPGAVTAYEAMVSQRPGPQSFIRIAQIRWLSGDVSGAIAAARHALNAASGPKEHVAWIQTKLAELLFHDGQLVAALKGSTSALKILPGYPQTLALQGRILLAQNQPEAAAKVLRQALERVSLPETQWLLIEALSLSNAESHAQEIKDLHEHLLANTEDLRSVSLYLAGQGRASDRALILAREEFEKRQDAQTLDMLAWALFAAGDLEQADHYSQRALKHGLSHGRIYLHAALIKRDLGDFATAQELIGQANQQDHQLLPSEQLLLKKTRTEIEGKQTARVL